METITTTKQNQDTLKTELELLGLKAASRTVDRKVEMARKMAIASEHHRVVTPKNIEKFNRKLRRRTLSVLRIGRSYKSTWQRLNFTPIDQYEEIPPTPVLEALKKAKELKCFDGFEVATLKVENATKMIPPPDPILFGTIRDCSNKYFIAQWDEDVAIEDILKRGEG